MLSLFLAASRTLLVLTTTGELDFDPTNFAVISFAAGAAAPIISRGAWSIIDLGCMLSDVMCESYNPTNHILLPAAGPNSGGKIGFRGLLAWTGAVFLNLMSHNVSFHKLAPYAGELFRASSYNMENVLHGTAVYRQNLQRCSDWDWSRQDWSRQSWASRLKGLLNLLILNALCGGFLVLQVFATLGESLILAVGSAWTTVAIAAHVNMLKDKLSKRRSYYPVFSPNCSGQPLMRLVESLICCKTCNHKGQNRRHLTGGGPNENDKAYVEIMPKARAAYLDWLERQQP